MRKNPIIKLLSGVGLAGALLILPAVAQNRDRGRYADQDRGAYTRIEPGTLIPVRTNETIDTDQRDNRIYRGIVDQDVRGDNGRLAIPRGATVEMIVRRERDNDLIIDLESVRVDGERYAIRTDVKRIDSDSGGLVGAIAGAITGDPRGPRVRIPRDSLLTFRVQRPLDMGVADRGVDREGRHYHDYYGR
ncbi:MAG TPA: hypothetical protein VL285_19950 [Bryobacteraceae bacterium]|jgi:hypothetical protein|nr:hypothetical protein [Bryobacteraceae bacterium]